MYPTTEIYCQVKKWGKTRPIMPETRISKPLVTIHSPVEEVVIASAAKQSQQKKTEIAPSISLLAMTGTTECRRVSEWLLFLFDLLSKGKKSLDKARTIV